MRFNSGNVIHVRHKGVVHWALLTETVPHNHVRFLCELHFDLEYRYRLLLAPIFQVEIDVDVDCMACCTEGCFL